MTPKNQSAPLIPYIRQSRAKEKTISLEEQRRAIQGWAKTNKVELAPEVVEQGVSGSKAWRERALGDAMKAVENGLAQGIIVAYQDRLSRENGLATAEVWQALEQAQARLVCAGEGLDTATGDHEMLFTIKSAIAREQWKRHRSNWENARANAVDRGIHVTPTLPAGYDRDPVTRRLISNQHARTITAAFEARANGASWTEVAKLLDEGSVRTSHEGRKRRNGAGTVNDGQVWDARAAVHMLRNRVYLGEARSGEFVKKDAHEPLVSPGLWARVQGRKQKRDYADPNRERPLLAGLVRCATCGGTLTQDSTRRNGKVYPFYRCKSPSARCSAHSTIGAGKLEQYVIEHVLTNAVFPPLAPRPEGQSAEYEAALTRVDETTAKLDDSVATWTTQGLSAETIGRLVLELEKGRADAIEQLNALPVQATDDDFWKQAEEYVGGDVSSVREAQERRHEAPYSAESLLDVYPLLPKELQRKMLKRALAGITVKPGRAPVEKRVTVKIRPEF